jgi:hypothetical protein
MMGLGCFVLGIVLLLSASPSDLSFAFNPLVWSPDGKYLAFGIEIGAKPNWKLFVVDSDGDHLHKLVDREELFDNEGAELYDFQWDAQSSKIYFKEFDEDSIKDNLAYYVIDRDGENLQRISTAKFPVVSSSPADLSPGIGLTECDKAPHIESRATHPGGLVAQSACLDSNHIFGCHEKLQVCDTSTGELVFTLDDHMNRGWLSRAAEIAGMAMLLASGLIFTAGIAARYRAMRATRQHHNSGG